MCFAGMTFQKIQYISQYAGVQDKIHTIKDVKFGNYHYWCVDKTNGNIIDKTPLTDHPKKIYDKPLYMPWTKLEQENQSRYNLYHSNQLFNYKLDEILETIYKEKDYKDKQCFMNTMALHHSDPDRYDVVCGSLGWVIKENKKYKLIDVDYGY